MPVAYEHRRRLPHYQPDDKALLVNFRTLSSVVLPPAACSLVLEHCLREHKKRVRLYAGVIMPDHVHLLFTPLRDEQTCSYRVSVVMQAIKGASSHSINKLLARSGPVWQEEYFDHVVRSYESLRQKIEYIRQNPVRRGLARVPEEFPWLWAEYEVIV